MLNCAMDAWKQSCAIMVWQDDVKEYMVNK